MKKVFEVVGLGALIMFSFYYTEKAAIYAREQNPIIQTINEVADDMEVESINAIVDDNTIIPGLYGRSINVNKSFSNMKNLGIFNEYYLIYDDVSPDISLKDNDDKTIISGNKNLREVSIIINNNNHLEVLSSNEVLFLYAADISNYQDSYININTEEDTLNFNELNKLIDKNNSEICLTNTRVNINECRKNNYYLVKPSLIVSSSNFIDAKKEIDNGSIIYIDSSLSNDELLLFIKEIKYKGLDIVLLTDLIDEKK